MHIFFVNIKRSLRKLYLVIGGGQPRYRYGITARVKPLPIFALKNRLPFKAAYVVIAQEIDFVQIIIGSGVAVINGDIRRLYCQRRFGYGKDGRKNKVNIIGFGKNSLHFVFARVYILVIVICYADFLVFDMRPNGDDKTGVLFGNIFKNYAFRAQGYGVYSQNPLVNANNIVVQNRFKVYWVFADIVPRRIIAHRLALRLCYGVQSALISKGNPVGIGAFIDLGMQIICQLEQILKIVYLFVVNVNDKRRAAYGYGNIGGNDGVIGIVYSNFYIVIRGVNNFLHRCALFFDGISVVFFGNAVRRQIPSFYLRYVIRPAVVIIRGMKAGQLRSSPKIGRRQRRSLNVYGELMGVLQYIMIAAVSGVQLVYPRVYYLRMLHGVQ